MFAALKKNRGSNELFQFMNIFNEDDCYVKPSRLWIDQIVYSEIKLSGNL